MKSWRTTTLGVCTIIGAVAHFIVAVVDGDPSTKPSIEVLTTAVGAGWGLILAKDDKKEG